MRKLLNIILQLWLGNSVFIQVDMEDENSRDF